MPRRKTLPKIPDLTGIPDNDEKLVIQKSNPLLSLSETEMSLPELKILDAYLSKIDSHNAEKRYVRFEKGELEQILGVSRILKADLQKRLKNLFQVLTIRDPNHKDGFTMIALFEKAEAFQDDEGLWQVDLACTPSAMEYIFNIEVIGYLSYMLKDIIGLTSRYSYILYLYLENNRRYRTSWVIHMDALKTMLRCTAATYEQYYRFNDLILKKCHRELNEKTSIRFSYEPVRTKGRRYTEIRFTVEPEERTSDSRHPAAGQLRSAPASDTAVHDGGELAVLLGEAACKHEFSPEQVRILQALVLQAVPSGGHPEQCDYLRDMIRRMDHYGPQAEKRFSYLCQMIRNDIDRGGCRDL